MTIDEAIEKYKEITNTDAVCPGHCNIPCEKCLQESEQLAGWLEKLRELRVTASELQCEMQATGALLNEKDKETRKQETRLLMILQKN